jgi:glyceraldehyde 3-phosphate dehydrogenase
MVKKVAINGLGRIGRAFLKLAKGIKIVGINDLIPPSNLAYLLKHDSVYGNYNKVSYGKDFIKIKGNKIPVFNKKNPSKLPWKKLKVDVALESTGLFTDRKDAKKHLEAGAKKVLISAPAKNPDKTIVLGVNDNKLKKKDKIISNASCTTNCLAPVAKILNDKYGIKNGFMTTIHAYTSSQKVVDSPSKKIRRGRAAALNLVPTTTGASEAVVKVIPELKGKLDGMAIRAPIPCGSIVDFVAEIKKETTKDKINKTFKKASKNKKMKGILQYSDEPLVSSDIIKNPHSSIIDSLSTKTNKNLIKILAWYDNEWGYSARLVDLVRKL